jgi:glycine/D-amino acid oxidase-like deaminating enzyme
LRREFEFRRRHGFDVRWLERAELAEMSSIRASAAIDSTGDAQIDPYRLTLAVLRKGQTKGLRIHAQVNVDDIAESDRGVRVTTSAGIVARRIVYATATKRNNSYRKLPARCTAPMPW